MKAFVFFLIFLIISSPVYADKSHKACNTFQELSEHVMTARQYGAPMAKTMETMQQIEDTDIYNISKQIIITAYESPRFSNENSKEKIIVEFQNLVYLECVKAFRGRLR